MAYPCGSLLESHISNVNFYKMEKLVCIARSWDGFSSPCFPKPALFDLLCAPERLTPRLPSRLGSSWILPKGSTNMRLHPKERKKRTTQQGGSGCILSGLQLLVRSPFSRTLVFIGLQ